MEKLSGEIGFRQTDRLERSLNVLGKEVRRLGVPFVARMVDPVQLMIGVSWVSGELRFRSTLSDRVTRSSARQVGLDRLRRHHSRDARQFGKLQTAE